MNTPTPKFMMTIDLNVLNHLGMNLYSNIPAVISEVVANAWDADAEEVFIDFKETEITIRDTGTGMDISDINNKFLLVGYQRRVEKEGRTTPIHTRPVMGRKGISKTVLVFYCK
ncbi:MAG: ATP-binding protein [Saprospiraceae bacterium]|nr:ATP-binding protein [Saprospiraceae bacterium]